MHNVMHVTCTRDEATGEYTQTVAVSQTVLPNVITAEEAICAEAEAERIARTATRKEQLRELDMRKTRSLSDAVLYGLDISVGGATPRERLRVIDALQDEIRQQLE